MTEKNEEQDTKIIDIEKRLGKIEKLLFGAIGQLGILIIVAVESFF